MKVRQVAIRYARSLFDLALERKELEPVYRDIRLISKACSDSRDLRLVLKSPVIKTDKKERILKHIFGTSISELTMKFLFQLIRKKRESFIPEIADAFIEHYYDHHNILIVKLKTAVPPTDDVRKRVFDIMKKYTRATIELIEETDPEIIGGFVLSWKDMQYDSSADRLIERLRRSVARVNLYVKDF